MHSIEAVRQLRGHHPREYSINEDAPPLRPPGPHSSSSREAADFWRKSDSSEELKGSSSASASNNQSDWPLSPLMASEADISEAADASGHSHSPRPLLVYYRISLLQPQSLSFQACQE